MQHLRALCDLYERLDRTSKRLEKTRLVSDFLKGNDLTPEVFLLLQGSLYAPYEKRKLGFADQMVQKALSIASGHTLASVKAAWRKEGDLGLAAERLIGRKTQHVLRTEELSVGYVVSTLRSVAHLKGPGSADVKTKTVAKVLSSATALEARYVVRMVLEDLRIGLGDSTIRDAVCWTVFGKELGLSFADGDFTVPDRERYQQHLDALQEAYDTCLDFFRVYTVAKGEGVEGLQRITIEPGKPFKVMLYPKAKDMADAFATVGSPCVLEYKYDGFRMVIHKDHDAIRVFTRRLEEVTERFPEVVPVLREQIRAEVAILDAEAVGYDPATKAYLPFQRISQRIQRKYDIATLAERFPVEINVFDVLLLEGRNLMKTAFSERRDILERVVPVLPQRLRPSVKLKTDDVEKADLFYRKAIEAGFEGVMAKSLSGIYRPGARVGYGVKVKPVMEPLDVVIMQAEWGEGKRGQWLSSFSVAVQDEEGSLLPIGKVSSGLKEVEENGMTYAALTERLLSLKLSEEGRGIAVRPEVILEVSYEEIQESPTYASGYALRFPRILRLRDDKGVDEISDLSLVRELFALQKRSSLTGRK